MTQLEPLELRRHADISFSGRILTIVGTERADVVSVSLLRRGEGLLVQVNGIEAVYRTAHVRAIRIQAGAGDDSVLISPRVPVRASVEGGRGNDRISGGSADDTLVGDAGNDTLAGNAGKDYIDAGAGDDYLYDNAGISVFHGGSGKDRGDQAGPYSLGSGIETGHPVSSSVPVTPSDHYFPGTAVLRRVNGRLTLRLSGSLPSISNSVVQTGPTLRSDGAYDVTTSFIDTGGGAIVGSFSNSWDLENVASKGVIFTAYDSAFAEPTFSVPLLLPTK